MTASIALLADKNIPGPAATGVCRQVKSVTIYPSGLGDTAGHTESISDLVRACGTPRTLLYLPGNPASVAPKLARAALASAETDHKPGMTPAGDAVGFRYGADSNAPTACGPANYSEPVGTCSRGTDGSFGIYVGEQGASRGDRRRFEFS